MRTWERTRVDEPCGKCDRRLPVGTPIQVVTLPHDGPASPRRVRCEACADAPVDEAALERFDIAEDGREQPRAPAAPAFADVRGMARELFDAKLAQAGRDE